MAAAKLTSRNWNQLSCHLREFGATSACHRVWKDTHEQANDDEAKLHQQKLASLAWPLAPKAGFGRGFSYAALRERKKRARAKARRPARLVGTH